MTQSQLAPPPAPSASKMPFRAAFAAYLLVFAVVAIALFVPPQPLDSAIVWADTPWEPVETCPGETHNYPLAIVMLRPGTHYVAWSIIRADDHPIAVEARQNPNAQALSEEYGVPIGGDTAYARPMSNVVTLVYPRRRLVYDVDASFEVPDLEAGPYERVLAAGHFGLNSRETIRVQPFTIPERCFNEEE